MPRLLPSFGRSSKEHARGYTGYDGYDAPHGYYDGYGYEEQEPQTSSAWRKVFPKKLSKRVRLSHSLVRATAKPHLRTMRHMNRSAFKSYVVHNKLTF